MITNRNDKFTVTTQMNNGACIVSLCGELDLSVAPGFRQVMGPLVENRDITLILDLKELKYIDSTGIGILLSILKARHGQNAGFYVREIPVQIQRLFDLTGIAKFFVLEENSQ